MFQNSFIAASVVLMMSCSTAKSSDAHVNDLTPNQTSHRSTVAKGILLSKSMDKQYAERDGHPCAELPCIGQVYITEVTQKGMDYHGQIHNGDTVNAHFIYTLGNSASYFPAKKPAPNAIDLQSVIEITIRFEPDGSITVADHKETNR